MKTFRKTTLAALFIVGLLGDARAQTAPIATPPPAPSPASIANSAPFLQLLQHESATFSDASESIVDVWDVRVSHPEKITLQLWLVQNGQIIPLKETGALYLDAETTPLTGRLYFLRGGGKGVSSKKGITLPLPGLSIQMASKGGVATMTGAVGSGQKRDVSVLRLPDKLVVTMCVTDTKTNVGIAPGKTQLLWAGQTDKGQFGLPSKTLVHTFFQSAEAAVSGEGKNPLTALAKAAKKSDTLLVLTLTWRPAEAKTTPAKTALNR